MNYNRDLETFSILKRIIEKITGEEAVYKSPTDMGKLKALNIITKGAFYSHSKNLRKIENQLLIDPLNEHLKKQEKEIKESINSLKLETENTPRYIRIIEQLNRDLEREKSIYEKAAKNYNLDISNNLDEKNLLKFYENKYKNTSIESLEFRVKDRKSVV